ncbi:MAG: HD domain-containing phosphohydrolase [bacterium]
MLSAGFALMALVPILLAMFLLDHGGGTVIGLPGAIVFLMLASALAGFFFIRRELQRTLVDILRAASREASGDLSDRLREASEDEIGKISATIQTITAKLQERSVDAQRACDRLSDGISRVAHAAQAANSAEHLLELLVQGATECLEGRVGYVISVDEEAGDFVTRCAAGDESDVARGWRTPLGEGVPGRCARERRSLLLSDLGAEELPAFAKAPTSTVAAPLLVGEALFGVVVIHDRRDGAAFTEDDASALGGFATIAAVALGVWGSRDRLEQSIDDTISGLVAAIEARDPYARGHAGRVARYCEEMARALRLDGDTTRTLRRAALIHDVGKVTLPETLLRKEGRFTPEELELVRTHSAAGEKLVRGIPALASLAPLVRHHHERCDGSGYPDGLKADAIPIPTHVLIVANAFDIMTSDRSYRKAMSLTEALETLRSKAGVWYDRRAVHALLGLDRTVLHVTNDVSEANAAVRGRGTASISVKG